MNRHAPAPPSGLLVLALGCLPWLAPPPLAAQPLDCLIQPNQVVQVGAAVSGLIQAIDVERGDPVRRGQVVARLAADVERVSAELAQTRAAQSAELKQAERSREFARREMTRARDLVSENFVSKAAVDKAETESQVSDDRLQQALERRRQAELELRLADAQLQRRQVRAPISGIVTDRFMSAGEFVEDKPILRIVEVNPLRVEVVVPAPAFGLIAQGARATVRPEVGTVREAPATVTIVDRVLDPASNTFRVRLTLPNPDLKIPAGARCKVDFGLDAQALSPRSPGSTGAVTPVSPPAGPALRPGAPSPPRVQGPPPGGATASGAPATGPTAGALPASASARIAAATAAPR